MVRRVTCIAPSNIATIKYWGKRDEDLILPVNDSISVTLSVDLMHAKTTVCASPHFKEHRMWLNKKEEEFSKNPRLVNCVASVQEIARRQGISKLEGLVDWKLHICSENNFPTAAGLASSAAGYACLVYTLAQFYGVDGDLTALARRGSGSACRSLYSGFVRWHMGNLKDGSDSIATQIAPASHWPDLRILILVVQDEKKDTSSTSGMQRTAKTSELFNHRIKSCVPENLPLMVNAIQSRDFFSFAELTMRDSNQLHAVAFDTYPPIRYMTDTSYKIVLLVHAFNEACGEIRLGYTFDAGPNACLFFLRKDAPLIISMINYYFPQSRNDYKGKVVESVNIPDELKNEINIKPYSVGLIKGMIFSEVGEGPRELGEDFHLLGENGLPVNMDS